MARELTTRFSFSRSGENKAGRRKTLADIGIRQVLDEGTVINGEWLVGTSVLFKGRCEGSIRCNEPVVPLVTPGAEADEPAAPGAGDEGSPLTEELLFIAHHHSSIRGTLRVPRVVIYGTFDGEADVRHIRLARGARVRGVIRCEQIVIDVDAQIEDLQVIKRPFQAEAGQEPALVVTNGGAG